MSDPTWTRRRFLKVTAGCSALLAGGTLFSGVDPQRLFRGAEAFAGSDALAELARTAPRARYWISAQHAGPSDCVSCHPATDLPPDRIHHHERATVLCGLCARNCMIAEGERGLCRDRVNVDGELRTLVYGRPLSVHVDPIEKKPFYHFLPGSAAYSLGTSGCPLRCQFCQNWEISQSRPEDYQTPFASPADVVAAARDRESPIIAFTYNEPTTFTEYLTDIAREARSRGVRSVLVSCGFMNEAPLAEMIEVLDAIKIDLKGFSPDFYRTVCQAELEPVLRSIRQVARSDVHLELVNLVVPTLNDSEKMLTTLAEWAVGEIGPDVPVHFTRFHPDFKLLNLSPTPIDTLERAREIAMKKGMHYAYVGNVPGHPGDNTYCPGCGRAVIERTGFFISSMHLKEGRCANCGHEIAGVWS